MYTSILSIFLDS